MNKEIQVAVIGDLAFDTKKKGNTTVTSIGGGAYGCCVGASKFTDGVGVVSQVGNDFDLSILRRRGIDTSGIKTDLIKKTTHFQLTVNENGEREVVTVADFVDNVDTGIFPKSYFSSLFIHLSTSHPEKNLTWIGFLNSERRNTTVISTDVFELYARLFPQATLKLLSSVDLIFINEEEQKILSQFGEVSNKTAYILKRGEKGASYVERERIIDIPAPVVNVVDTTGAGDILAGAFLALRSQGVNIVTALEKAVNLASYSVTEYGLEHV